MHAKVASCLIIPLTMAITCEFSKKLLGRDIGEAVEVPAIAMATVWLIRLFASPSASSPLQPTAAPCGPPGRPHWLWDSDETKGKIFSQWRKRLIFFSAGNLYLKSHRAVVAFPWQWQWEAGKAWRLWPSPQGRHSVGQSRGWRGDCERHWPLFYGGQTSYSEKKTKINKYFKHLCNKTEFECFFFQLLSLKEKKVKGSVPTLHFQGPISQTVQTAPALPESVAPWRGQTAQTYWLSFDPGHAWRIQNSEGAKGIREFR